MKHYIQQQQMQMAAMQQQMAQMNTSAGTYGSYNREGNVRSGIRQGKMVKSPYSKFSLDPASMDMDSGEVIYDPFTGKPFRIP